MYYELYYYDDFYYKHYVKSAFNRSELEHLIDTYVKSYYYSRSRFKIISL